MNWLRDIFWLFQFVMVFQTAIPIILGGVFLGLAASKITNAKLRTISLIGIVVTQAITSVWGFLDRGIDALAWLMPFWIKYPYVNMGSLLFFWIPVIAQLYYVTQKSSPKFWMVALIGFLTIIAGALFLFIMGSAVGAETD